VPAGREPASSRSAASSRLGPARGESTARTLARHLPSRQADQATSSPQPVAVWANSSTRRVLPMPAEPRTIARLPRPCVTPAANPARPGRPSSSSFRPFRFANSSRTRPLSQWNVHPAYLDSGRVAGGRKQSTDSLQWQRKRFHGLER
jgi:hypothetical protein